MRIALVNEFFPPHATEALARALVGRGQDVVVMTPNWGAPSREERGGFRVRRFPWPAKRSPGPPTGGQRWLTNPLMYVHAGIQLIRLTLAERVDVLHAQNKHMLIPVQ